MLVKAKALGFYGNIRRYTGDVFEMSELDYCPKDQSGNPYLDRKGEVKTCKWVEVVDQKKGQPQKPKQASDEKSFGASKKDSSVI